MASPALIYCGGGNKRFAKIAVDSGFLYGARLPDTIYHPLYFADQNWKNPDRKAYMSALEKHSPKMATVIDWEKDNQFSAVMSWAEQASQFVETVLVIPKIPGTINRIPRIINGKRVVLAYSVPTAYGGTPVPIWEFSGWPIHLLGGSPQKQMMIYKHLKSIADVVSIDGNHAQLMANKFCAFFKPSGHPYSKNKFWPTLSDIGDDTKQDANYKAFAKSCASILQYWKQ